MFTCYQPRRVKSLGVQNIAGFQLKTYAVFRQDDVFDPVRFERGLKRAVEELPSPPATHARPGAGFVIFHQGATGDYVVLCWWDNQNELPTRVFVRDGTGGGEGQIQWRPARLHESFCVWDLAIMWFEREAYIASALTGADNGLEKYLNHVRADGVV